MSRDQRERHLKKVAQGNVIKEVNQIACQLPVPPEKFHTGLRLPLSAIQGIWKEASELGSDPTAISAAPGYGTECRMVISKHGKRPHLVSKGKPLGKFSCDNNCPNWKSLGLCSHVVAVAQVNGQLTNLCNNDTRSNRLPSITGLLVTGLPSDVGNKDDKVTTK